MKATWYRCHLYIKWKQIMWAIHLYAELTFQVLQSNTLFFWSRWHIVTCKSFKFARLGVHVWLILYTQCSAYCLLKKIQAVQMGFKPKTPCFPSLELPWYCHATGPPYLGKAMGLQNNTKWDVFLFFSQVSRGLTGPNGLHAFLTGSYPIFLCLFLPSLFQMGSSLGLRHTSD